MSGRTKIGRLWAYTRDDRSYGSNVPPGRTPQDVCGILQVDGYTGFEALAEKGTIALAAC